MKTVISIISMLMICSLVLFGQHKSDFATVQRFQTLTKTISKNIDEAKTVQECAEASTSIDAMEKEFSDDKALIDKANYPDGYDKTIEQLRGKLLIRQKDIGVIETQMVRISELEVKVRELSGQITNLTSQNEKLMADLQQQNQSLKNLAGNYTASARVIDSLHNLITKLRQGLQERDALIFALADSLFLQYDKNVADMKDVEKQGLIGKMEKHGVIGNIKSSIIDNVAFLATTQLKGNDLVTIVRQQKRFQSQWTGLGSKIAALYLTGKAKKNEVVIVDSMLAVWGSKIDVAMWRSLNTLFKEKGFAVKEFNSGDEFTTSFIAFIDEQIQNTKNEMKETSLKLFTNFNDNLWQVDLNVTWLPALVELGKITDVQKKNIEDKVDQWRSSVSPGASWLVYLLVAIAIGIAVMVWMRYFRKKPQPTPQG